MTKQKISMGKDYQKKEDLMQNTLSHLKSMIGDLHDHQELIFTAKEFMHEQGASPDEMDLVLIALRAIPIHVLKMM